MVASIDLSDVDTRGGGGHRQNEKPPNRRRRQLEDAATRRWTMDGSLLLAHSRSRSVVRPKQFSLDSSNRSTTKTYSMMKKKKSLVSSR